MKTRGIFFNLLCAGSLLSAAVQDDSVVILGSGPAGLTAAIYTARAGVKTLLLEGEEPGGQITYSNLVENFPGFPDGINGYDLGDKMRDQAKKFGAEIRTQTVASVDLSKRPFTLKMSDGSSIQTPALIIATGASAKWLGLPSEKPFLGQGVYSCATCDGILFKDKDVVVVGGGDSAMEDALFLSNYAKSVAVVHRRESLKASQYLQNKAKTKPNIRFIWNSEVVEILDPKAQKVTGVKIRNSQSQKITTVPCDGVFVAIGHTPNTKLFNGQLSLDKSGYIITEPLSTQTNVPGVYAAGDVADPHYRQAITAAGMGSMAGIDVSHYFQKQIGDET